MKHDRLIIVDNIPLFCSQSSVAGEKQLYVEIEKKKPSFTGRKVYFLTADIDSIYDYTRKMTTVFKKLLTPYIVLMDRDHERKVWAYQIPEILIQKQKEKKREQQVLSLTRKEIRSLRARKKPRTALKEGNPAYLKLTLNYGMEGGGAVAHAAGVVSVLQKRHPEMPIYTTDYLPETIDKKYIKYISLKAFRDFEKIRPFYFNFSAREEIAADLSEKQISYIYQRSTLGIFIGAMLADEFKVPFVLEYNGPVVWTWQNWGRRGTYDGVIASDIEKLNLDKADLIVCVSEELKPGLLAKGVAEEKILVNCNGVDIQKYHPACNGQRIRKMYGIQDKTVIGFSGSFEYFHGVDRLAEAYGRLIVRRPDLKDKIQMMFIGEGRTRKTAERKIKEYKLADCVTWTGKVPFEEVQDYLAACDILVAPHLPNRDKSPFFGSPTKLFEYMAMGKAIAASNLNQIGRLLEPDCALLVEPGNVEELSQALERLIDDEDLRARLGKNARERVAANYTWEQHVDRIESKLHELYG